MPQNRSLSPVWNLLRPYRAVLRNALFASLAMAVASIFIPNQFRSESRVLPDLSRGNSLASGLANAAAMLGVGGSHEDPSGSYVDILESRWLMDQLLETPYSFQMKPWRFAREKSYHQTLRDYYGEGNLDRAVIALEHHYAVSRDPKTSLVTVTVESRSPQLSQSVAQRAVALLGDFLSAQGRTRGSEKAIEAGERLAEAKSDYLSSEAEFKAFLDTNRNYGTSSDPGIRLKGERLQLDLALKQQVVSSVTLMREQALIQAKDDAPILNVLDKGTLPEEKSWPHRSVLCLFAFLSGAILTWAWQRRGSKIQELTGPGGAG